MAANAAFGPGAGTREVGAWIEAECGIKLLDDDTVRTWHRLYEEDGIEGAAELIRKCLFQVLAESGYITVLRPFRSLSRNAA